MTGPKGLVFASPMVRVLELRVFRGKPALVPVEARLTRGAAARGATRV